MHGIDSNSLETMLHKRHKSGALIDYSGNQMTSAMAIPVQIPPEIIYTGVFLDEDTQESLRVYYTAVSGEELLGKLTDCHLTLSWNPRKDSNFVKALPFGSTVKLRVIGMASDAYLQSLVIEIVGSKISQLFD